MRCLTATPYHVFWIHLTLTQFPLIKRFLYSLGFNAPGNLGMDFLGMHFLFRLSAMSMFFPHLSILILIPKWVTLDKRCNGIQKVSLIKRVWQQLTRVCTEISANCKTSTRVQSIDADKQKMSECSVLAERMSWRFLCTLASLLHAHKWTAPCTHF